MRLSIEKFEEIKYYIAHNSGLKKADMQNMIDTIEAQHDEIESLKNWNVCEAEDHERLIESDKRRIELEEQVEQQETAIENMKAYLYDKEKEIERLKQWVNDLQSGMYVNCVYCGHRYGPESETPTSMADVLKEHIEHCKDHPMSKLKQEFEQEKQTRIKYQDIVYEICRLFDSLNEYGRRDVCTIEEIVEKVKSFKAQAAAMNSLYDEEHKTYIDIVLKQGESLKEIDAKDTALERAMRGIKSIIEQYTTDFTEEELAGDVLRPREKVVLEYANETLEVLQEALGGDEDGR